MKPPHFSRKSFTVLTLFLVINGGHSIRNLFLPRSGEIKINPVIAENLSNVTNFQSLLGAGRSLAYPFAAGMLLSIATLANENNWKVSDAGFSQVLGIPRTEILESYGALLDMLETDENVTLSNVQFSLRPNHSPSEDLTETLMTEVREVTWTRETWRETYNTMVEHLSNVTNEKIDTLLIPSVTKIGTPFRKATEAVILNTFHYINGWQHPWTDGEIGTFQGNGGIPYLKSEGKFWVAEEDEFTAVAVPLEGGTKNVVFVLPHVNITARYFRHHSDEEGREETDIVPFPTKWELKRIRLQVPAFNTTDVDQYGQELEQVGVNETFCTIIRDYFGRYPYYMRPMVQVNFLDFNEDFLELASATGVAVERFQSLFSTITEGDTDVGSNGDEDKKQSGPKQQNQNKRPQPQSSPEIGTGTESVMNGDLVSSEPSNGSVVVSQAGYINLLEEDSTTTVPENDIPTYVFDRSFLWYLNDSEVGPMFFGTVELLVNLAYPDNSTEPGGEDEEMMTTIQPPPNEDGMNANNTNANNDGDMNSVINEIEKFYLWSCRSFAPMSSGPPINGSTADGNRTQGMPSPSHFAVSFDQDVGPTTNEVNQIKGTGTVESINEVKPKPSDDHVGGDGSV